MSHISGYVIIYFVIIFQSRQTLMYSLPWLAWNQRNINKYKQGVANLRI